MQFSIINLSTGYVSLFRVGGVNNLDFDKVLDKQEGRILCLDWHTDGRHIVTGRYADAFYSALLHCPIIL